jgi:hypothetical protein
METATAPNAAKPKRGRRWYQYGQHASSPDKNLGMDENPYQSPQVGQPYQELYSREHPQQNQNQLAPLGGEFFPGHFSFSGFCSSRSPPLQSLGYSSSQSSLGNTQRWAERSLLTSVYCLRARDRCGSA